MHGGGSCSPCWTPAPLSHPKPRRKHLKTGHCSASGLTPLPLGEAPSSTSPCQTVHSNVFYISLVFNLKGYKELGFGHVMKEEEKPNFTVITVSMDFPDSKYLNSYTFFVPQVQHFQLAVK